MIEENPCNAVLSRTYAEILADEELKKQFRKCLYNKVFRVYGLRLFHMKDARTRAVFNETEALDETEAFNENATVKETALFIEFTEKFFANQPNLQWSEKPSDTRIRKFYEILKTLQKDFKDDFKVSSLQKPSSTNLCLWLELALKRFQKDRNQKLESMQTMDIVEHLKWLWQKLLLSLSNYGFEIE
jgi:hypothetical protein